MLLKILSYLDLKFLLPVIHFGQMLIVSIGSSKLGFEDYPMQAVVSDGATFDFIVVGAGSAGCVVAKRLTEVTDWTVLLIEAGDDPPIITNNPTLSVLTVSSLPDWNYFSVDDEYASQAKQTKTVHIIRGKRLGGSSSINYMYHVKGNKADYDSWADQGNPGWDWDNVKYYFNKAERIEDDLLTNAKNLNSRGIKGFIGVTRQDWPNITKAYLKAFEEVGHILLEDYNADEQLGYSTAQFSIAHGIRQSTVATYLRSAKSQPNLFVLKKSLASKVILDDNKKAIGVEVILSDKKVIKVKARKEVIISAGAINSPQLLMLSGIGPKDHLAKLGIKIIQDSQNIGENLQDHVMASVVLTGPSGFSTTGDNFNFILNFDKFPIPTIIGFTSLNKSRTYPDYQTTVCPLAVSHLMNMLSSKQIFDLDDETTLRVIETGKRGETLHALVSLLHPESKGRIKLKSSDPEESPLIYNGYFTNKNDLENFATYMEDYVSVVKSSYFKSIRSKIVNLKIRQCKDEVFGSHEYWKCYVLNMASSHYHQVGTCAMGPEGTGVVDERLLVRGVKNLRIVDASVMPSITSGNTNVPVIMIAEKASDMIKNDHGKA